MTFVSELEPTSLWQHFDRILTIPRGSKNEAAISDYILSFAADKGLDRATRKKALAAKDRIMNWAAYREIARLDQKQLNRYLAEYRADGYVEPAGYVWNEQRSSGG